MTEINKKEKTGTVLYLKHKASHHPKPTSYLKSFFRCQNKEDKVVRNLWLFFVIGVFAFSSLLWNYQEHLFSDKFNVNDSMMIGW